MLTDYERYQLEWMIEHGHSLKEFVQGLDLVDRDGIDSLEDVYAIWENDYGFGGEVFSNEREFKEEDLPEIMRKPEHETEMGRILKKGGALYSPERGIVIASYLKEEVSPRIEVYYGYPPYVLASLVGRNFGVTVDSSIMDIQDALADPSLPRRFDHELADFASVDEFMSSRFPNSATDWLDVSGNTGLEDMLQLLDIKQTDNVREWYMLAFPDDELVTGINPRLTFVDAIAAVPTGDGFYTALGETADSLLRERIFEELCNRYGYTYDEVYDSWLNESPLPSPAISQQPEKIAVAAGYRFNLMDFLTVLGIIDSRQLDVFVYIAENTNPSNNTFIGTYTKISKDVGVSSRTIAKIMKKLQENNFIKKVQNGVWLVNPNILMKGATYEDSRKVDDLLDSHGDKPISDYRKRPQGMSLKQAVRESREASAKLAEENVGTDVLGKDAS